MKNIFLILLLFLLSFATADYLDTDEFKSYSEKEQEIIRQVVEKEEVQNLLPQLINWSISIELEGYWNISFYEAGEWVGYVLYNEATNEIETSELPEFLAQEEVNAYEANIKKYLFDDPAIKAIIENANIFNKELNYNKYSNYWSYYLYNSIDSYEIIIYPDDVNYFTIDEIRNYNAFDDDQKLEIDRNTAIELAYSSPKINEAFDGIDDWFSYAEQYENNIWIVEFAGMGRTLLSVLVDIDAKTVLESNLP